MKYDTIAFTLRLLKSNVRKLSFTMAITIMAFSSCNDRMTNDPPLPNFSISQLTPNHAPAYATITIEGVGFSSDKAKDIVRINNVAATVKSATATSLTVVVPPKAGSGAITVSIDGKTATTSASAFTYDKSLLVSTIAGNGTAGYVNATGTDAQFRSMSGIYMDAAGDLYIGDAGNNVVRKMAANALVSTFAGTGNPGMVNGPRASAQFNSPGSICKDPAGNLFVVDELNRAIRKINTNGDVSTVATFGSIPTNMCIDAQGNLYLVLINENKIKKITPQGTVTTLAGSGTAGNHDANGTSATFNMPVGICIDSQNNLYITDGGNSSIRKIASNGDVTTIAGGTQGFEDGLGTAAKFYNPDGICIDNQGNLYVADFTNHRIRKVAPNGQVTTFAGNGNWEAIDNSALHSSFRNPAEICIDQQGNLYVVDYTIYLVRKIAFE